MNRSTGHRTFLSALLVLAPLSNTLAEDAPSSAKANGKRAKSFIAVTRQAFLDNPGGRLRGFLHLNTPVLLEETKGDWVKVSVEGWVKKDSVIDKRANPKNALSTTSSDEPLVITSYSTKTRAGRREGVSEVVLKLTVQNQTEKNISAWQAVVMAIDDKDKVVMKERLVANRSAIKPKGKTQVEIFWTSRESKYEIIENAKKNGLRFRLYKVKLK